MVANSSDSDLESITCSYRRMLTKEYRLILAEVNGRNFQSKSQSNFALCTSPKTIFNSEENVTPSSSNHILEEENKLIYVSEPNCTSKEDLLRMKLVEVEPKFMVFQENRTFTEQQTNSHQSEPKRTLNPKSTNLEDKLTQDFLLHEIDGNLIDNNVTQQQIDPQFVEPSGSMGELDLAIDESSSDVEKIYLQEESRANFFPERSPSPFPTYERMAPRNSICSELLEDPTNVNEQEEDESSLNSYYNRNECMDDKFELEQRINSLHEYRSSSAKENVTHRRSLSPSLSTKLEVHYERRNRSVSPCKRYDDEDPATQQQKRSKSYSILDEILLPLSECELTVKDCLRKSPFRDNDEGISERFVSVEELFDEALKNSLDGVKKKNTNEERKRNFKRKRNNKSRSNRSPLKDQSYSSNQDTLENIALKESLLELGSPTEEDVSFCSNFLVEQNVVCRQTSAFQAEENLPSKLSSTSASAEYDKRDTINATEPKPGPSKEENKPEPFWVN